MTRKIVFNSANSANPDEMLHSSGSSLFGKEPVYQYEKR